MNEEGLHVPDHDSRLPPTPGFVPWIDAATLRRSLTWVEAVDVLEAALVQRAAPGNTPARSFVPVSAGELILMPGEVGPDVGVKVVSVHDGAPERQHVPRIQGVHVALDGATLTPTAVLDAAALTVLRTSALSALAIRHLAPADARSLLVFGTGPQAVGHALAIHAVRPLDEVVVVGRREPAVAAAVAELAVEGLSARPGTAAEVAGVDLVACCTTAADPLFDSGLLRPEATVVAIGSHSPTMREVDFRLVEAATVIVESRASALSQAGDVILAIADGVDADAAIDGDLGELVRGELTPALGRPRFFKSVGEAWADVVVAAAVVTGTRRSERPATA